MKLFKILEQIEYFEIKADLDLEIEKVISLKEANLNNSAITWCSDKNYLELENLNTNSIIIVSNKVDLSINNNLNYLIVENPRKVFQEILVKFYTPKRTPHIHDSAVICSTARLGNNLIIGCNVVIEENCIIGDLVTILHNTIILKNSVISNNVTIGCNTTIGGVGFGYEKDEKGIYQFIPHLGNVLIEENVEIGNNVCIDRAVLGSTILKKNVKVDNLVHIAHGVIIDENSLIIANAMIGGSTEIGKNVWIAPSSTLMQKIKIEDNATVGLGAVVLKSVEEGTVVVGNPAKKIERK
jgi:UDP-3-O-[3-hydroxymyristoyl] glucosamine N-acyltransferase